ncbi:nucleotidyl transferase AbiEii/AbiGii toxin family protein [Lentisphaera profundi]|uniref:Nucleotidyl transferase AbiEii/AbiGii toxin family protein n=1 Tax=Lentisphaera profundi TaxID=1658616 RepID=A0ABY7VVN2_9BACT|nr:nucleotidyl transferase AbiEii/AbiGii toxin family protein [Lentisphaera profundi]WDE97270.1 nucleotidyl transferase AbiEii/AbiGii toxin family protein [Lentisphaera profundi]
MKITNEALNFIELQYVQERFLYRLSQSTHKEQFVLKGGTLFYAWAKMKYRPTKDLDFMFYGDLGRETLLQQIKEICAISYPEDGIAFQWDSFSYEEIKENHEYDGVRIHFEAKIGSSRITMKLDVCTGDKITPQPEEHSYPNLLGESHELNLKMYPKETVIAEKVHAMISLDIANSRMKDFFDVYILLSDFEADLDEQLVAKALAVTFEHRATKIPSLPARVWKKYFYADESKNIQWNAFLKRNKILKNISLEEVCKTIGARVNPLFKS